MHATEVEIDESALTGESLPKAMSEGGTPLMGSNCVRGEGEATVEFTGMNTFFGRTAALLQVLNHPVPPPPLHQLTRILVPQPSDYVPLQ